MSHQGPYAHQPPPPVAPAPGNYPPPPEPLPPLVCPLCRCQQFQREESRSDSRWGFTSHRMTMLICLRCRHVLHFYDNHSIFDFD